MRGPHFGPLSIATMPTTHVAGGARHMRRVSASEAEICGLCLGSRRTRLSGPDRRGRNRGLSNEPFGMGRVSGIERGVAPSQDDGDLAEVDHRGRQQPEARVTVVVIVPRQEELAERVCVYSSPEAIPEVGPVLQRPKPAFGGRVVVKH